jgi:hypothetical protein
MPQLYDARRKPKPTLEDIARAAASSPAAAAVADRGTPNLLEAAATPGNVLIDYASDVYSDLDQTLRDLITSAPGVLETLSGSSAVTPDQVLGEMASGMVETYSDPVGYANEHPGQFLLDLVGLAVAGGPALRAAKALDWADETGSVGAVGRSMDAGDFEVVSDPNRIHSPGASPLFRADMATPEGISQAYLKPSRGGPGSITDQGWGDIFVGQLNRDLGDYLYMPSVQRWTSPSSRGGVLKGEEFAVIEPIEDMASYLHSSRPAPGLLANTSRSGMPNVERTALIDLVLGNPDRSWAHNLTWRTGPRDDFLPYDWGLVPGETGPITNLDQLYGQTFQPLFHEPELAALNIPGRSLSQESIDILAQIKSLLHQGGGFYSDIPHSQFLGILRRIEMLQDQGRFPQHPSNPNVNKGHLGKAVSPTPEWIDHYTSVSSGSTSPDAVAAAVARMRERIRQGQGLIE